MKSRADIEALKRELNQRINLLNNDSVYLSRPDGRSTIIALRERLEVVELISNNLGLLDWLVNENTDIKRADLVSQDKV